MPPLTAPPRPLRFPQDIFRLLYWIVFKPVTLTQYLKELDSRLKNEELRVWKVKDRFSSSRNIRHLVYLVLALLGIIPVLFTLITGYFIKLSGGSFIFLYDSVGENPGGLLRALGFSLGALFSFFLHWKLRRGALWSFILAIPIAFISFGVVYLSLILLGIETTVAVGVAFGVAVGVAVGVAFGVAVGVAVGVAGGVAFGVAVGVAVGVAGGVAGGVAFGVAVGVSFILSYFRLFIYPFQAPCAFFQNRFWGGGGLRRSPVYWDETIWLPLPGLDGLLTKIALKDRQEGMEAIAYVAASFKQGWAAKKALLELTAYDLSSAQSLERIAEIAQNLSWLPDNARMDMQELLRGIEQASQHAQAALESETLYNRQEQLRMALQVIERVRSGLAYAEKSDLARKIIPALEGWQRTFGSALNDANLQESIPNVYVSGSPLIKDSKSFKGRRDLFRTLTNQLVSPAEQRPSLLLFGARRMGKTSTLKQLPVQLGPQIIPVSIDLQTASTVASAAGLLFLIAKEIVKSAHSERRVKFPPLDPESLAKDPYLAFQEWLSSLDEILGDYHWILLALDEYESLGGMLADGRVDERIFQLVRGIIQHHHRITVLLSGAHTLEELPPLWSNYFINSKMLKVSPLQKADAIELITRPLPDFPLTYAEDALEHLLAETGCYPNWVQFACLEIVEHLNSENRFLATLQDVKEALATVPEARSADFTDIWQGNDATDLMRTILKDVATAEKLPIKKLDKYRKEENFQKTLNFILRRDMLIEEDETYRFRANLLRRWIASQ